MAAPRKSKSGSRGARSQAKVKIAGAQFDIVDLKFRLYRDTFERSDFDLLKAETAGDWLALRDACSSVAKCEAIGRCSRGSSGSQAATLFHVKRRNSVDCRGLSSTSPEPASRNGGASILPSQ